MKAQSFSILSLVIITILCLTLFGCTSSSTISDASMEGSQEEESHLDHEGGSDQEPDLEPLVLPKLAAVELGNTPLKVVATTSIIGDVVAQVGGDAIDLTTLMGPGQDPHSYEPGAQELTIVAKAQVIFVNGWDLEEALVQDLEEIGGEVPLIPISANIQPLAFGERQGAHDNDDRQGDSEEEHGHNGADPHVWFSIQNVKQWVKNVEQVLSDLDPANAVMYERNAAVYLAALGSLQEEVELKLAQIPDDKRFLVTNHDSLSYFAQAYRFRVVGTVIPTASTLAEPSASDLAELIREMEARGVCSLFTEATASGTLAQTIATELEGCDEVRVSQLYTGAVGPAGSGADSYIGMFRYNVDAIVSGLR